MPETWPILTLCDCSRVMGKPEVIGSSVGLVPRNARSLSGLPRRDERGVCPWAALVAWTNIWPEHRIVNQRADTPSGGKLLLST
jgi:hypothetical protein